MNEITIIDHEGILVVDSRNVAAMVGKRHDNLVRDIKGYCETLDVQQTSILRTANFFIPSTYTAEDGSRTYPCYLLTKKGCDMVANKMTGEKGVRFTAMYIDRFYEMEKALSEPTFTMEQLCTPDGIVMLAQKWKVDRDQRIALEEQIKQDEPFTTFGKRLSQSPAGITLSEYAKVLASNGIDIGRDRLLGKLLDWGWLYMDKGRYTPKQRYIEKKWLVLKESVPATPRVRVGLLVTGSGQRVIEARLRNGK